MTWSVYGDFQFDTSHYKTLCLWIGSSRRKKEEQPAAKSLFAVCKVLQSTPFHTVNSVGYDKEAVALTVSSDCKQVAQFSVFFASGKTE